MILSDTKNSERIEKLHPNFKLFFDYIKSHDLLNSPLGRIELDGDNVFINNVESECVEKEKQVLELHRDYIDIHVLLSGSETIGWKTIDTLQHETKPYKKYNDCALYSDTPTTFVNLQPGEFVIAYPEDAHAPIIGKGKIRKLIGKIKL